MVSYGFFNSLNHDRRYNALDFSQLIDSIITDGIFPDIGDEFEVTSASNGMMIYIGSGRAWLNHTWTYNDEKMAFILSSGEPSITRIDAIVIEVNHDIRMNSIKIIEGVENNRRPTWTDTETVKKYPIAYITIPSGTTELTSDMILNVVGDSVDGVPKVSVNQSIDYSDIDNLTYNWRYEFDSYFSEWSNSKNEEFDEFLNSLVNHLTREQIGEIQASIISKENKPVELTSVLLAGKSSLTFEDASINNNSAISIYSDPFGISVTGFSQNENKIYLNFKPVSHDTTIEILVRNQ